MEKLKELREYGESLGYEGESLQQFIKEQQVVWRDERQAERERQREQDEYNLKLQQVRLGNEKFEQELRVKELEHAHQMDILNKEKELSVGGGGSFVGSTARPCVPKIPAFDESRDEMDSYLRRFERYAIAQKWPSDNWATNLSALLKGKALDVYALMPSEQSLDYHALKTALLKRYDLTEDGFKRKFRSCRPDVGETFVQFMVRMESYFIRWLDMAKVEKTFEAICDLMIRDQLLHVCSRELGLFLRERVPKTKEEMAILADQFREARLTNALSLTPREQGSGSGSLLYPGKNKGVHMQGARPQTPGNYRTPSFVPKSERRCYRCSRQGHIASECRYKSNPVTSVLQYENVHRGSEQNSSPEAGNE